MMNLKVKSEMCTSCFATISIGQASCTANIFGAPKCVKCASGYDKFDSIYLKQIKNKSANSRKLELAY